MKPLLCSIQGQVHKCSFSHTLGTTILRETTSESSQPWKPQVMEQQMTKILRFTHVTNAAHLRKHNTLSCSQLLTVFLFGPNLVWSCECAAEQRTCYWRPILSLVERSWDRSRGCHRYATAHVHSQSCDWSDRKLLLYCQTTPSVVLSG